MKKNLYAVIMAGGIGSRFWPLSKKKLPKQFLDILGNDETLIQQTYRRLIKICPPTNILVVTNKIYKDLCLQQLPELKENNILCEPAMRNTAPCIAYAVFKTHTADPKANIIIAPSDHLISDEDEFVRVTSECMLASSNTNDLFTIGIKPSRPETGYGYIQFDDQDYSQNSVIKKVKTFTEKPNQELALQFIDSGDFLWNSGIFISNADAIILSYRKYLRDLYEIFEEGRKYYNTTREKEFIDRVYPGCKSISIDYGIMEKSENTYVYPANFGWSDLGTWGSLHSHQELDSNNNTLQGEKVLIYDSTDNIIKVSDNKLVVLQGLNGYIIVDHDNTLLICKKVDEQKIKEFVSDVKRKLGDSFI